MVASAARSEASSWPPAPRLFSTYLELPLGVTGSVLLAFYLLYGFPLKRLLRLALLAALAFASPSNTPGVPGGPLRNFYGVPPDSRTGEGENSARAPL